jgi:transposase
MSDIDLRCGVPTVAQSQHTTLFVALELSRKSWFVALSAPGDTRVSKFVRPANDGPGLVQFLKEQQAKVEHRIDHPVTVVVIEEAGLDGFWLHRLLEANGMTSQVVDPASIAVDRRARRRKTDRLDLDSLMRTLMAWSRGERGVCSMVHPPTPEEEDRRRITREREELVTERTRHINRVKGLLAGQGIVDFEPRRADHRARLDELRTGDGRPLPPHLKQEIRRHLARLAVVQDDIAAVETERDAVLGVTSGAEAPPTETTPSPAVLLLRLKGIGPECAAVLWLEVFFRRFHNRREVAGYAGLAPAPWQSGSMDHDQGISKAGNPHVRQTLIQMAWLWLRYQPDSAISRWFTARVGTTRGRIRRIAIVAVARRLLVALWRYVTQGILPEGAVVKV